MDTARIEPIPSVQTPSLVALPATPVFPQTAIQRVGLRDSFGFWVLSFALLHGMLYWAIVPPWQHYDEPTHFEYAHMLATRGRADPTDPRDLVATREIADSMYRFHFWRAGERPDLLSANPPALGADQRVHPSLYYAVAALPIRLLRYAPVEQQLAAARLVSVLLYALTVLAGWRVACVVAPDEPALQLVVPLLLAVVPAFGDIMTAVNNDVLVNFSAGAMLLGCVLLVRDGVKPLALGLAVLALLVGLSTKRTAVALIVPFVLALTWAIYRQPVHWRRWGGGAAVLLVVASIGMLQIDPGGLTTSAPLVRVRPWLDTLDKAYLRLSLDATIGSLTNWERSAQVYPWLLKVSFDSFWVRYGWGDVALGRFWEYGVVGLVAFSLVGLCTQRSNHAELWQRRCGWLFFFAVVAAVLALVVRVHPLPPIGQEIYLPRGRYAHLALLPTVWLLTRGFQRWWPVRLRDHGAVVLLSLFVLADTVGWLIVLPTFHYAS